MCYHAEFGRSAFKGVVITIYRRIPKIGEPWNSAPLGWKAWLTPTDKPPPHCYHVKFVSPATKGVRINRKETEKLGSTGAEPLAVGRGYPIKYAPPPHVLSCRIWPF